MDVQDFGLKCTRVEQVIFHQLHKWSALMVGGRERTPRYESSQISVLDQDVCGLPGAPGAEGTKEQSPLQADGFFVIKITTVILHSHWKRGGEEDGLLLNLFKSLLIEFLMSTHIIHNEVPRSSCKFSSVNILFPGYFWACVCRGGYWTVMEMNTGLCTSSRMQFVSSNEMNDHSVQGLK